jgi:hypothetical protein
MQKVTLATCAVTDAATYGFTAAMLLAVGTTLKMSADRWPDETAFIDIEPVFVCTQCGAIGAVRFWPKADMACCTAYVCF